MCDDPDCTEHCSCWEAGYEEAEKELQPQLEELEAENYTLKEKLDNISEEAKH